MRVGRVLDVEDFPEARRPAWKLRIDFGPEIGVRRSSAQIKNYAREDLEGRLGLAVVNFPPRQIGPVRSEVLTLGTYSDPGVLLVSPDTGAQPGDRLGEGRPARAGSPHSARGRAPGPRQAPGSPRPSSACRGPRGLGGRLRARALDRRL